MDIWVAVVVGVLVGAVGGFVVGVRWAQRLSGAAASGPAEESARIHVGLVRLEERLRELEHRGSAWQGQFAQHVDDVRHSTDQLRLETGALSTALRQPQVRGQWGELHLRRAVELAGLVAHCDFSEQATTASGALRPDMIVQLPGGRQVVLDAKTPLIGHLDAMATTDEDERRAHLRRHARHVRGHVDALSKKAYWQALPAAVDFVVMFLPTESALSTALEADPELLDYAAQRDVLLTTPTSLIALLRSVAHGWTTQELAERTQEVLELGRQLYARLGTMGAHLTKLGRSLQASVEAFNASVGSIEGRVMVTARQFEDLGIRRDTLPQLEPLDRRPRGLTAEELLREATPQRLEIDPGQDARTAGMTLFTSPRERRPKGDSAAG